VPHKKANHVKFLAARHKRLDHVRAPPNDPAGQGRRIAAAVVLPFVALLAYGLLTGADFFSVLDARLHAVAALVVGVWAVQAVRGSLGLRSYRAHLGFFLPAAALVAAGSCWGWGTASNLRVHVTPPPYARAEESDGVADKRGVVRALAGGVLHIDWQGEPRPLAVRFLGKKESAKEGSFSFPIGRDDGGQEREAIVYHGMRRFGRLVIRAMPDLPPEARFADAPVVTARQTVRLSYEVADDQGVEAVLVRVLPVEGAADPTDLFVAKPVAKRVAATEFIDLTHLPMAGRSVGLELVAVDGAGNRGTSDRRTVVLPVRSFRNPFARALIEERRKLFERPDSSAVRDEAANVLAGIARQQGIYKGDQVAMLALRAGAVRLVLSAAPNGVEGVGQLIWQTAVRLEEGAAGVAHHDLMDAVAALLSSLGEGSDGKRRAALWENVEEALARYAQKLEIERTQRPPALHDLDWPLVVAQDSATPEELQARLAAIAPLLSDGKTDELRERLALWQKQAEGLWSPPPDLTPEQTRLAGQVASLRGLFRSQKALNEETEGLAVHGGVRRGAPYRTALARILAQQQLMLAALRDIAGEFVAPVTELNGALSAMATALQALQKGAPQNAAPHQQEATALVENALLTLTEQIRQSLTADVSEKKAKN